MSWEDDAYRYAIKNAFLHHGKAELAAVMGKVLALHKGSLDAKTVMPQLKKIVNNVNSLSFEEIAKEYEKFKDGYELKPKEKESPLPKLEWAEKENVVTRFAPNPNGPFHLGNARAAILSHEFARTYNGKFILRFDDTDPKVKKPIENAEEIFKIDLEWLGIQVDETYFASDRLEIYYKFMQKTIEIGKAYICTCNVSDWREKISRGLACKCRDLDIDEQKKRFEKMLSHDFKEGEAVLRIKTNLQHKDPSIRDWWAARIVDDPKHPRVGANYHLWPSYNFASAIDDHELGVTLIVRGQEHEQNMTKQKFLYDYFGWQYPHAFHFGRIKLQGVVLSTSKIAKGIEAGIYDGWDDIRLGTIKALKRRGFDPRALKDAILELGVNPVDASIEMKKLAALNKKYIESESERVTFIPQDEIITLEVINAEDTIVEKDNFNYELKGKIHKFIIPKKDVETIKIGEIARLRNAYNIKIVEKEHQKILAEFAGKEMLHHEKVLAWIFEGTPANLKLADNSDLHGLIDCKVLKKKIGNHLYLEKIGYVIIDGFENNTVKLRFTHE